PSGTGIYSDTNLGTNVTIQNVTASHRNVGLQLQGGGQDLTLTNNNLANDNTALYLDSFSVGARGTTPVVASSNVVTNSSTGFQLFNMNGQFIGTSGTGIIINNATDGLNTAAGIPIRLQNDGNFTISGVDVSWTGGGRAGPGIYADGTNNNLTITGVNAANRDTGLRIGDAGVDATITNNTLTNNSTALFLNDYSVGPRATVPVVASGNRFTGSDNPLWLYNMTGQFIGTSGTGIIINNATDGLNTTAGIPIRLSNDSNFTISGVDVSWTGGGRVGQGIYADGTNNNLTITGVNAANRDTGLRIGDAGVDATITNNTLTNNSTALFLQNFSVGPRATVPVVASGNRFTGSDNPL